MISYAIKPLKLKFYFTVLTLLIFAPCGLSAIDIPQPRCAEVLSPSGDVVISWSEPDDPSGLFFSYLIYELDDMGNVTQLGEIFSYNITSYTHIGADALFNSRSYFLRVRSGNSGQVISGDSEVISTIYLEVVAGNLNAVAFLDWNAPFAEIPASSSGVYDVFREDSPGNWVLVGSTLFGEENFADTVQGICNDPPALINYRVEISDNSGCTSVSNIAADLLTDGIGPTPPVIETVTVDTLTNQMLICWYPSPEADTEGYIVQDNTDPMQFITIGQVAGAQNTEFLHQAVPSSPRRYLIIAFDECENDQSFGTVHESMFLTTSTQDCDLQVDLDWTAYQGWPNGVLLYEVYASENGAPFQLMQTNLPNNRVATIDVNPFSSYCFRVKALAVGPQKASFTNTVCLETTYPEVPEFTYLNRVDVLEDEMVEVNLLPDNNAFQMEYRIERRDLGEPDFEEIGLMTPVPASGLYRFYDEDVTADTRRYEYRVAAYDFCQNFDSHSNVSGNILLNTFADSEDFISRLQWNAYQNWNGGVAEYRIYRSLGKDGGFQPLATVPGNVTYFEDDVYDLIDFHGEFCYYIEARENLNSFGRADSLRSNISCAVQEPLLWIPSAFVVGGFNPIFKPVAGYLDFERYEMKIYSRWGKLMFTSNELDSGWNGEHNGKTAPDGVYIYVISFSAGDGKRIEKKGHVMLLNAAN